MAELLVVGSVALDSVATPFGKVREVLGGSATYFSYAASFFTRARLVAAVGEDFPKEHTRLLEDRGVDVAVVGVEGAGVIWRTEEGDQACHGLGQRLKKSALIWMKLFHFSGSASSAKIAVTGHSGSQAPQSMHSSG